MKFTTLATIASALTLASAGPVLFRPSTVRPSANPAAAIHRRADNAQLMRDALSLAARIKHKRQESTPVTDPAALPTVAPTDEEELAQLVFRLTEGNPDADLSTLPKRYTEVDPATVPVEFPIEAPSINDEELAFFLYNKGVECENAAEALAKRQSEGEIETPILAPVDDEDPALFYYEKGVEAIQAVEAQEVEEEEGALKKRQEPTVEIPEEAPVEDDDVLAEFFFTKGEEAIQAVEAAEEGTPAPVKKRQEDPSSTVVVPSELPTEVAQEEDELARLMFEWATAVEDEEVVVVVPDENEEVEEGSA